MNASSNEPTRTSSTPPDAAETIEDEQETHASLARELRDVTMRQRGIAVGVSMADERDGWSMEASLDELTALAATAGVAVVAQATQRLDRPAPATFIGSGKVQEIKAAAEDLDADVVLFDRDLNPRQQRNLERELDCMVLDRTALILDVFSQHARTREGMLQVELAQNEYRLPRLTRLWTHLARQAGGRAGGTGGGVGLRGPGETQIEIDRRLIGRRIATLKEQIDKLRTQRRQSRKRRGGSGLPVVALVGYTNAGKSTLLNQLTGDRIYAADQLFATLDPTTRRVGLPSGREMLMTDTVGFIQKLPTQLVAAFRATLEEIGEADLLLHVVDATHPDAMQQAETVERVLDDMGLGERPMVVAANKIDRLMPYDAAAMPHDDPSGEGDHGTGAADDEVAPGSTEAEGSAPPVVPHAALEADTVIATLLDAYPDAVAVSAKTGAGFEELRLAIDAELSQRLVHVAAEVPYTEGELVHRVHEHGIVEDESYTETGTRVRARVPTYLLPALASYRVDGGGDEGQDGEAGDEAEAESVSDEGGQPGPV